MKYNIRILIIISLLLIVINGCGEKEIPKIEEPKKEQNKVVKLSAESIKLIKLETESVSSSPLSGFISLPAKVIPNQDYEAQVGTLVQGRVNQVFVKIGDFVKTGQVLMTVEGLDIGTIKAGFLKAKALNEYTKANYDRQQKLFEDKIGSQKTLLESQAEYAKALAEFKAEDRKIHSVGLSDEDIINGKSNDDHTSGTLPIKSPISGIIVERNVVIGQLLDPSTNAFRVINTNSVWIDGQIYEKDLSKINHKTSAVFTSSVYQNEKFDGNIIYIGQSIDEKSRTLMIRGEFSNANNKLKPQMFGELRIPIGENTTALMIPEESVVKETGKEYVFVQTSEMTFEQRIVITGISVDNKIEIKEGLKAGEKIVSKGVFFLKSELKKDEIGGD
jgi:cobalt-zinc-cadmium efflux system membrane fusion protein